MARGRAQLVVQRGTEITRVLDPLLAREHLLRGAQSEAAAQDADIQRLAKSALSRLESIDNVQYAGIGAAVASLYKRFDAGDKPVLKQLRRLHEAHCFVRHLTLVGEAKWSEALEDALGRVSAKDQAGRQAEAKATTSEGGGAGGEAVDEKAEADKAGKKAKKRRGKKGKHAMEVDVPVDELALQSSGTSTVVVAPAALQLLALSGHQDQLEDDTWADGVPRQQHAAAGSGRKLEARRSGSRTPPSGKGTAVKKLAARLEIGATCRIRGLTSRPELEGKEVIIGGYDDTADRFSIMAPDGDMVMVPKAALVLLS